MSQHAILVVGALGRMGHHVRAAVALHPELRVAGALEASGHPELGSKLEGGVSVTDDAQSALAGCDAVIDFSIPAATLEYLGAAAKAGVAYVTGTTGLSPAQKRQVAQAASKIAVIHAANFSLSVNVLAWLTREAAAKLGPAYDAELIELHHAAKRDAPSGTALRLAEAVAEGRRVDLADHLVLAREGETGARPEGAIGIQTLRGGDSPGEHTVLFIGKGERLELIHRASTRDHFAKGAANAAAWLVGRPPGLYPIEEVFGLEGR